MAVPNWALKRKKNQTRQEYQKAYYTAQRENAQKTGDIKTLGKIKAKLDAGYKPKSSYKPRDYSKPDTSMKQAGDMFNNASRMLDNVTDAGANVVTTIEGGRALGGLGKAVGGLFKGGEKVAQAAESAEKTSAKTKPTRQTPYGSNSKYAGAKTSRKTTQNLGMAKPVRTSLNSARVKGTSYRRPARAALEAKKALPSKSSLESKPSLTSQKSLNAPERPQAMARPKALSPGKPSNTPTRPAGTKTPTVRGAKKTATPKSKGMTFEKAAQKAGGGKKSAMAEAVKAKTRLQPKKKGN